MDRAEIVITGIGMVCAVGYDRGAVWQGIVQGVSGIAGDGKGGPLAGRVDVDSLSWPAERPRWGDVPYRRAALFAQRAVFEAISQSQVDLATLDATRLGLCFGCGSAGSDVVAVVDGLASAVGSLGTRIAVSTGCSSGATALGLACQALRRRECDIVIAGAAEQLEERALAGFEALHALDRDRCSPYTRSAGLNPGEGSGMLVLERRDFATSRGAAVIAEVAGVGLSCDAYHPTAPDPEGVGLELAIRRALRLSNVTVADVQYINGHGTATRANDTMELAALGRMWPPGGSDVPLSSTKAMTGHCFGATAAIEVGFCALALERGVIPPTLNTGPVDSGPPVGPGAGGMYLLTNESKNGPVDTALSLSAAFGGHNAAVVVSTKQRPAVGHVAGGATRGVRAGIVGFGVVGCLGAGREEWWDRLEQGVSGLESQRGAMVGRTTVTTRPDCVDEHQWRRMGPLARQHLLAVERALVDAGPEGWTSRDDLALITATEAGGVDADEFVKGFETPARMTPLLFANGALDSAAGHVCRAFRWRGPSATIVGGGHASVSALLFASRLVEEGEASTAVVVAGDVLSASAVEEYRRRGLLTGGDVRPCDHSSDGAALSGVSIAIVLQGRGRGRTGRPTYGDVLGGATVGVDAAPNQPRAADPWERAIHQALCSSGVAAKEIDYVVASAAGSVDADRREMSTVSRMIGSHAKVTAPKGLVGDSRSAAGLIGVLVSGLAFERGVMVGMPWLRRPMCSGRIEYVSQTLSDRSVDRVLVNAGSASAVGSVVIGSNSRTTMNGVRSK